MPARESHALDVNAAANRDCESWSETRWHCCWSPETGVGIYIHAGRFRQDIDMWWAHVAAFLPDGKLAVSQLWCRNTAAAGLGSDTLDLTITTDGWHSTFDGVGELTDTVALSRSVRGAGAPSIALRWDVNAVEAAPVWDLYATTDQRQDFASDLHLQQAATTAGTLWVGAREFSLHGVGFKDHSSGSRSFADWNGHRFLIAIMPGWVVHAASIFRNGTAAQPPIGIVMAGGRRKSIDQFDLPALADPEGMPRDQDMLITGPSGPMLLHTKVIHALPITITNDNDNYNGIDWDTPSDPMVMIEGLVQLTAADGSVGFGFLERSARQSALPIPHTGYRV